MSTEKTMRTKYPTSFSLELDEYVAMVKDPPDMLIVVSALEKNRVIARIPKAELLKAMLKARPQACEAKYNIGIYVTTIPACCLIASTLSFFVR